MLLPVIFEEPPEKSQISNRGPFLALQVSASHWNPYSHIISCKAHHMILEKKSEPILIPRLNMLHKEQGDVAQNRRSVLPLCHCSTGIVPEEGDFDSHWISKLYIWPFQGLKAPIYAQQK